MAFVKVPSQSDDHTDTQEQQSTHAKKPRGRYDIRILLSQLVLGTVFLSAGAITGLNYLRDIELGRANAEQQFEQIAHATARGAARLEEKGERLALALARSPGVEHALASELQHPLVDEMAALMTHGDAIFSLFIGHPNGDYFELSNLEASEGLRNGWEAEEHHRWVALKVFDIGGERTELREFLSDDLEINNITQASSDYRAHKRPWFKAASTGSVHRTEPYVLRITDQRGFSHVMQSPSGHVVGAIMLLSSLNQRLANRTFPNSYFSVMFDEDNHLLAQSTSEPEAGSVTELGPRDQAKFKALTALREQPGKMGKLQEVGINGETFYVFLEEIGADDNLAQPAYIGLAVSEAEVLAPSISRALHGMGLSLLVMLLVAPFALFAARSIAKPIRQLTHDTQLIRARRFAEVEPVDSHIREVTWLSDSLVDMSAAICDYQEQ